MTREDILNALQAFAESRPGFEPGNYISGCSTRERWREEVRNYRSEVRGVTRQLHDARRLLAAVRWRTSIGVPELKEAFRAYSGRLTLTETATGGASLSYCAGQYYCVEFRAAVCAVLSAALWAYTRACIPKDRENAGDWIRNTLRKEFGRHVAQRWLS